MNNTPPEHPTDNDDQDSLFEQIQTDQISRSYIKVGAMVVFVTLCVVLFHFTPLKEFVDDIQKLKQLLDDTGYCTPLIYVVFCAALIFVGAPRLALSVIGGMLFGFVEGLSLAMIATMAGAYGPFLFARWSASGWVDRKLKRMGRWRKYLQDPSILDVFVFRQIPIWGVFINLLLGTTSISTDKFFVGSVLGFLPQTMIFVLIGSGLGKESMLMALSQSWGAIPLVLIGAIVTWRLLRRAKARLSRRMEDTE